MRENLRGRAAGGTDIGNREPCVLAGLSMSQPPLSRRLSGAVSVRVSQGFNCVAGAAPCTDFPDNPIVHKTHHLQQTESDSVACSDGVGRTLDS